MKRAIACALALVAGCSHVGSPGPAAKSSATIYNAIDFGLGTSIYFAVSRIDGTVAHRKFDRDPSVRTTPGPHELRIGYYFEGFSGAAEGAAECRVELDAKAGADYYIEGATENGRWRARVVDSTATAEWPCSFPDGSPTGAVTGSARSQAVSSRPRAKVAWVEPSAGTAAPAAAALTTEGAEERNGSAARPPSSEGLPATAAVKASSDRDRGEAAAGSRVPAGAAAAASTYSSRAQGSGAVGKVLHGRGHWGCPANLFRVSAIEAETIALGGNERIRLLGVEPLAGGRFAQALEPLVDQCVSLEFDQALAGKVLRDRDGSLRAYVIDANGELVNAAVIRRGGATVDPQSRCRRLGELMAAQSEANAASADR